MTAHPYIVTRRNTDTGDVRTFTAKDEHQAREYVFWCAYDNLQMNRREAGLAADAVHSRRAVRAS